MDYRTEFFKKYDKRLSKENQNKILKVAKVNGWTSCYFYIEHLIYIENKTPREIIKDLKIKSYVYYMIANRISLLNRDNLVQKENFKLKEKFNKKMCAYCGKKPRDGAYYCKDCRKKTNVIANQFDLDMMGDY